MIPVQIIESKGYITLGVITDPDDEINDTASFLYPNRFGFFANGHKVSNQTDAAYGCKFSKSDIVSTIIDFDKHEISFAVNG